MENFKTQDKILGVLPNNKEAEIGVMRITLENKKLKSFWWRKSPNILEAFKKDLNDIKFKKLLDGSPALIKAEAFIEPLGFTHKSYYENGECYSDDEDFIAAKKGYEFFKEKIKADEPNWDESSIKEYYAQFSDAYIVGDTVYNKIIEEETNIYVPYSKGDFKIIIVALNGLEFWENQTKDSFWDLGISMPGIGGKPFWDYFPKEVRELIRNRNCN